MAKSRKDIIIEEAGKLFTSKGYRSTSIRELANQVGIEPSSIYSHVRSKEEILSRICQEAADYFVKGMEKIQAGEHDVLTMIRLLLDLHIDAIVKLPTVITVFTDQWKHLPPEELKTFLEIRKTYEKQWMEIIREGMDKKMIRQGNPAVLFNTILSSIRWLYHWYTPEKKQELKSVKTEIKSFILQGIRESIP